MSITDEHRVDAHRLAAIRETLEVLALQREHSPRCSTTAGIGEVRREAVEQIRSIVDPRWRPEQLDAPAEP